MFSILDYLDELSDVVYHNTWIQATCPNCGGKLKINNSSKRGSYACYSNECHSKNPNPIREKLYNPYSAFNRKNSFSLNYTKTQLHEIVVPKPISCDISSFLTDKEYIPPVQVKLEGKLYTYFLYDDFRITRLDIDPEYSESGEKEKHLFPEYLNNTQYVSGIPSILTALPIYQNKYIQPSMIFVEGEKCTDLAHRLGLAAFTLPSFAYTDIYFSRITSSLKTKVDNVLLIQDNDLTGDNKARKLCKYFWKQNINAKVVNLVDIFTSFEQVKGIDLYDFYSLGLIDRNNILNIVETLVYG